MKAEFTRTYIVLPFERAGTVVGARQALVFEDSSAARFYAKALGQRTTGVAILERTVDAESGEENDRLVASGGAVPPFTPGAMRWTMRLH
jgi:nitrous oxide reductase accessory protein NosL